MEQKRFSSKILLFGEHSIIHNSMGLAFPFPLFDGQLCFDKDAQVRSKCYELKLFFLFLEDICKRGQFPDGFIFDLDSFKEDLERGLIFDSSIPQGHGIGSSGALCAAIFHCYGKIELVFKKDSMEELLFLKEVFSIMESHFHEKSSGIDPLISFLNYPLLIKGRSDLRKIDLPHQSLENPQLDFFLLDTGRQRRTSDLVQLFLEKSLQDSFRKQCQDDLSGITNNCINAFLEARPVELFEEFFLLSKFQYEHFQGMIPSLLKESWDFGLHSKNYLLKLCGSGGGGFVLGVTRNFEVAKKDLDSYPLRKFFSI